MRIGLVAEVKWEVREVCRQLNMTLVDPDDEIWGATLNGHDVRLCLSGMIPSIAKERVTRFLDNHSPEIMISCGLAGALSSKVLVGDLIIQSLDSALSTHAEQSLSKKGISFHVGPLVTVSKPVLTPRRYLPAVRPLGLIWKVKLLQNSADTERFAAWPLREYPMASRMTYLRSLLDLRSSISLKLPNMFFSLRRPGDWLREWLARAIPRPPILGTAFGPRFKKYINGSTITGFTNPNQG